MHCTGPDLRRPGSTRHRGNQRHRRRPLRIPPPGVRITIESVSGYEDETETGADGRFEFLGAAAGAYAVTAAAADFLDARREIDAATAAEQISIAMTPEIPATAAVTTTDPQGLVLPGTSVTLTDPQGAVIYGVTGSDGVFRTEPLRPGVWNIEARLPGFESATASVTAGYGGEARATAMLGLDYAVAENVVVLGSTRPVGRRTDVRLVDSPVTTTVIRGETLAAAPNANIGDALRYVPGLNVVQLSARDIQVTSRQSTGTLANSQLVLLDGRSIYLDFFGMVLWDALPVGADDIEQIEVVRGPASVTWGPNAMTGAVHFITRAPREAVGTTVTMGAGWIDRNAGSTLGSGPGLTSGSSVSISRAPSETLAYRISAGYFQSDALPRPTGRIPVITDPRASGGGGPVGGAPYPTDETGALGSAFPNRGTAQPKFDVRVDRELADGGRLSYSGGVGGTDGVTHTGLGPFDLRRGAYVGYGKVNYTRNELRLQLFTNIADGEAPSLLLTDSEHGGPVAFGFQNRTVDFDVGHSRLVGARHVFDYGANIRYNTFDLNIAPDTPNRLEFGGYLQDEVFLGPVRLVAGGRLDKFGGVSAPFFSPRLSAVYKPGENHAITASYNRAFRSPSVIETHLDMRMIHPTDLSALGSLRPLLPSFLPPDLHPAAIGPAIAELEADLNRTISQPFPLAVRVVGNDIPVNGVMREPLGAEALTAYEIRYSGSFGGTGVGAAVYLNEGTQSLLGIPVPPEFDPYTADDPPPGWLLPPQTLTFLSAVGVHLPRTTRTFANRGGVRNTGVELWIEQTLPGSTAVRASYSRQAEPVIREHTAPYPVDQLSVPPGHRINASFSLDNRRLLANALVTSATRAFWADVLTPEYHGYSPGYTSIDASFGVKWRNGAVITSVKATNILNRTIQQHVFGDLLRRTVFAELKLHL